MLNTPKIWTINLVMTGICYVITRDLGDTLSAFIGANIGSFIFSKYLIRYIQRRSQRIYLQEVDVELDRAALEYLRGER